jgi:hypothetical protein
VEAAVLYRCPFCDDLIPQAIVGEHVENCNG